MRTLSRQLSASVKCGQITTNKNEEGDRVALIICVECGKEFSDKATACPNCGCPTEYSTTVKSEVIDTPAESVNTEMVVDHKKTDPIFAETSYRKENLFSYAELREFAFTSVLPCIKKELNSTVTDVVRGNGSHDDAHFYIVCGQRVIGIKVVIDAYPDVYNVGRFFNDDVNEHVLAKTLHNRGYECAVANIGIGARDQIRFSRRIFLKNDEYSFKYKQLRFVKFDPKVTNSSTPSGVRYSLSEATKDESWKKLAGFKHNKSPAYASAFAIQKSDVSKNYAKSRAISEFWDDDYQVVPKVEQMCKMAYVCEKCTTETSQLICYASSTAHDKISPEDMLYYVCNAVDFVTGVFLSDSTPVAQNEILIVLRELIEKTKFEIKYELESNEAILINYLIYIFITDREKFKEYLQGDYLVEYKGKRLSSIGYIYHATKDAFLENPRQFGYGQDVVDEIVRLRNINSPQNLKEYAVMRSAVETEMRQFHVVHEKVITKKTLQLLGRTEEKQLRLFSENVYKFLQFAERNFDENLPVVHKEAMNAFRGVVAAYQRCLGVDEVIISRQLRGKYGMFERMDDIKESKTRYSAFVTSLRGLKISL